MSYTFEENNARMTAVFDGIAKRTIAEVREEIAKANRTWSPARVSEAVANDPRVTNVLRAENVMKQPLKPLDPTAVARVKADVAKQFGDHNTRYGGRRAKNTDESSHFGQPPRDTRPSEHDGSVRNPGPLDDDDDDTPAMKQMKKIAREMHGGAFRDWTEQKVFTHVATKMRPDLLQADKAQRLGTRFDSGDGFGG